MMYRSRLLIYYYTVIYDILYIILDSLVFQLLSDFHVIGILLYYYILKFRVPLVRCGIDTIRRQFE